jgi:hypothetical protein
MEPLRLPRVLRCRHSGCGPSHHAGRVVPIEKRTLVDALSYRGTATLGFFTGGPILMIVAPVVFSAVRGVGGALWEGARSEVVTFSGDVAAWALDAIRARLGIVRGDKSDSD